MKFCLMRLWRGQFRRSPDVHSAEFRPASGWHLLVRAGACGCTGSSRLLCVQMSCAAIRRHTQDSRYTPESFWAMTAWNVRLDAVGHDRCQPLAGRNSAEWTSGDRRNCPAPKSHQTEFHPLQGQIQSLRPQLPLQELHSMVTSTPSYRSHGESGSNFSGWGSVSWPMR